ncbi:ATP-binding domain-containing 1 family member B [Coccidioides immitis H538.4]|uniref:GPN-loop GTPase 3 n=1 Tax=Coccidioides immitis H538.4 TaxID=396776 RepID=A0A0J8RQK0_COCIT|nr:ATP-binding domain-containing 1 family member B [Coccidioides immitis H538.4]
MAEQRMPLFQHPGRRRKNHFFRKHTVTTEFCLSLLAYHPKSFHPYYVKIRCFGYGPSGRRQDDLLHRAHTTPSNARRSCFYVNLDPAAESFAYEPDLDIRELITLEDVMEELGLGPNGGLMYCFEFLLQNLDFLNEALDPLSEEYLIIFDMPGQIELYTHVPLLPSLIQYLSRAGPLNISLCAAYLMESIFVVDRAKFFAGTLSAMSAMILLEIPHVNILSKMDQVKRVGGKAGTEEIYDEDSIAGVLSYIDDAIQFHEAQEPREPADEQEYDLE